MNKILKKSITFFFTMCFILSTGSSFSQELTKEDNDLLFNDIGQKQIVALGDATHTDFTASKFRVDLIKELIEKHNFRDRKSTRLNSSHVRISYAVFCLKK